MAAPGPPKLADLPPEVVAYSNGPTLLAITASLYAAAAVVVMARCHARVMVKSIGSDDWTMFVAMLFATVAFICYTTEIAHGIGRYSIVIIANPEAFQKLLMFRMIHQVTAIVSMSLVKISICLFLMRLVTKKTYERFLWAVVVFVVMVTIVFVITLIFQCVPVQAAWDVRLRPPPLGTGDAWCFDSVALEQLGIFSGVVNISLDFLLALLPVPLIWNLQMALRTRVTLILILSLGLFASIAGIIRQSSLHEFKKPEPWIHDSFAIWQLIELDTGIIAASLPALRPLFREFYATALSMTSGLRRTSYKSHSDRHYRQYHEHDREDVNMTALKSTRPEHEPGVLSKKQSQTPKWDSGQANDSEESILPHPRPDAKTSDAIVVEHV